MAANEKNTPKPTPTPSQLIKEGQDLRIKPQTPADDKNKQIMQTKKTITEIQIRLRNLKKAKTKTIICLAVFLISLFMYQTIILITSGIGYVNVVVALIALVFILSLAVVMSFEELKESKKLWKDK